MSEQTISAEETAPAEEAGGETVLTEAEATTQADDKIATETAEDGGETTKTEEPDGQDGREVEIDLTSIEMPEGFELDTALAEQAAPVFKELGLDQKQAEGLVQFFAQTRLNEVQSATEALTARQEEWRGAIKSEWGSNYDSNIAVAAKAVALGGDELRQALDETGAGDHPAVVNFFHKVGQQLSEDGFAGEGDKPAPSKTPLEKRLYNKMG